MTSSGPTRGGIRVAHQIPGRVRFICPSLHDPALDLSWLEALIGGLPGVTSVRINPQAASVTVRHDEDAEAPERVRAILERPPEEAWRADAERETEVGPGGVALRGLLAFVLRSTPRRVTAPASWILGLPTVARGVETLIARGPKVEVLDASAVGISLLRGDYFTANAIGSLLALGAYLDRLSEEKTTDLLKSLLRPQVETVRVEREGNEVAIPLEELVLGDVLIRGPGELIPVEGRVVDGEASINQSSITGESIPIHVAPGSEVLSGSVVEEGRLRIDVRTVGAETGMARIGRFLETSVRRKSDSQKQSDALADRLVPITLFLGILLFLLTRDVRRAASVLTVDYSCAVKVASPVAVKMGMFAAAREGVLLKGGEAIDVLSQVDTVVFDKTGTLTRGRLKATDILPLTDVTPDTLLALAAAAEAHYAHPVAKAVVRAAADRGVAVPAAGQVDFVVAHGVSAYVDGVQIMVGSRHFLHDDEGIDCSAGDEAARRLRSEGKGLLYVAREDRCIGMIAVRDETRPESAEVLRELKALGIEKTVMLTGDHEETAKAVAAGLDGLDVVHWDLKPEDKARIVGELKAEGRRLAFVGDGVNDAPALVSADVGVAVPEAADLARESARVLLLREDLRGLVTARRIAVRAQEVIRNSFYQAVGLNSLILLMAGTGRISPLVSAVLHNSTTIGILAYAALGGSRSARRPNAPTETEPCTSR